MFMTMKIKQLTRGSQPEYVLEQGDNMHVTIFEFNAETGVRSDNGMPLGKWEDIDDVEVQGQILEQLYLKRKI